ncbi:MAG TPA: hypothetical protein VET90_06210, partial [Candidatus Binatus sp.]|nr:hypothetical protein [Candidatus Binatus sp.]
MAEPEVFEARFAAAYRQYVAEVPTEVDAMAVARAAAGARPRFAALPRRGLFTWLPGANPHRLAILLLVGLLIAALTA